MSRDFVGSVALAISLSVVACDGPGQDAGEVALAHQGLTAGQWTSVGSLANARNLADSEVLANGQVLVMGGWTGAAELRSCEIYDPVTQSFRATGSLVHPRADAATVALRDGRVVLFGFVNGTSIQQGEVFDPATESWSLIAAHPATVWATSAKELLDGRVLVLGSGRFGQNALYDPVTNTWQSAAANLQTQSTNDATLLADGRVLISGDPAASEIYDPITDAWAPAGSLAVPRFSYTQTLLSDGRVFVAGGRALGGTSNFSYPTSTEIYDPATNTWSPGPNLSGPRFAHSARRLADGRVLLVGGYVEVAPGQTASLATTEVFDPVSNTVTSFAPLVGARGFPLLEVLANGDVFAAAGYAQGSLSTAEVYVPLGGSPADAGVSDSGLHPDATVLDSGVHPDATVPDSGVHPDATVPDSGVHPDATVPDSGVLSDAGTPPSGLVDLYIHDVQGSVSNGTLSSEVVVCNRGSQPTVVGSVEVRLSSDDVFDASDALLYATTPTVQVLGESCASTHIVSSAPSFSGARRLVARVDATNTIAESDETNNSAAGASVRLTGALPNLVIESADYIEGDGQYRFNVDATVCNRGAAPSSQVALFFTTSLSNPPGQPSGGGAQYPGLDPGACVRLRTSTNNFVAGGSRPDTLRLVVDARNAVAEDDETDNVWPVAFLTDSGPTSDLMVTRVDVPDAFVDPTRIVARVCNAGAFASAPTNVAVSLSQSPQDPGPVGPWALTTTLPVLDGKECVDARFELDPTGLPFALTHIGVRIDPAGLVGDYAGNNWFSAGWRWPQPTSPTPQPDLVVRTARMPTVTNGTETADITVCNVGDAPSPSTELNIDATLVDLPERLTPHGQITNPVVAVPALRAGACAVVTTSNLPLTTPGLATRLAVTVDATQSITELDEGNNVWVSEPIAFGSGPDLYVESGRAIIGASGGMIVEARICNQGYADGTFSEVDRGGVALDRLEYRVPNPGVTRYSVGPHVLAVNACVDLSLWVGTALGLEHFAIGIVGANDIDPRNDARRLSRGSIGRDFMDVQNLQVSSPVAPVGGVVDVSFELCGRGGAEPSQTLEFLVSHDDVRQAGDVVARTDTVVQPGLDVCVPMTVPVTVPSVADGRYRLGLALSSDRVARFAAAVDLVVGSGPDYTAELVSAPTNAQGPLSAEVEICNQGDTSAPDPVVHLLLSNDAHIAAPHLPTGSSDRSVGSATLTAPAAGQCNRGFVSGDFGAVPSGNYWIAAYVDWPDQIAEIREDNNVGAASALSVTGVPCGNSVIDPGEQCDDGNLTRGDGCDEVCNVEVRARLGEAVYVSGNSQKLTIPIATANHPLNPTDAFTFALWAREPTRQWETPANRWDSNQAVWNFDYSYNGVMAFTFADGSGTRNNYRPFTTVPNGSNAWVHYVLTYDRGTAHVYRNGVLDDGPVAGSIPSILSGALSDFHLGHGYYDGAMGNVMFLDRAVNATEVSDIVCALSDQPTPQCTCGADQHACSLSDIVNMPGLVSYWPMLSDASDVAGAYDFTEAGGPWVYNDRTPVVTVPDAGVVDSGIPLDSGVHPDATVADVGFPDTGVHPDATVADSGIHPDATVTDSGIHPDATVADSGIHPDASVSDAGLTDAGAPTPRARLGEAIYNTGNGQQLTHAITLATHPLNPTDAFTFALWAREPANPWETPANRWDGAGKVWNFDHNSNGEIAFTLNDGTGSRGNYVPFATAPSGSRQWVHYVMTFDLGVAHVYRNGVLDDGVTQGVLPMVLGGGTSDFNLGHGYYDGAMGNVMFLDRAVSPVEVQDIYCALSDVASPGCTCGADQHPCSEADILGLPGLVSYWPLSTGPQDVVGGFDFTEAGGPWVYNDRTPVVTVPDAGVLDSGILLDSGVHPDAAAIDAGFLDSGVHPDAALPDTGVYPDAATIDAGFLDSGVHPDASVSDAGLTDAGAPTPRARLGEAIYSRGNSQQLTHAITLATHPLNPTDAFTFALWAREPANPWETPANRWDGAGKVWNFDHNSNGEIAFTLNDGTGSRGNYVPFATPPSGSRQWVHYVMTFDLGVAHVYRNGVLDDGVTQGVLPMVLGGGTSDFRLGHGHYDGAMGNVMFLDRAVSPVEVQDIYCALSDVASPGCTCGADQHPCSEADILGLSGLVSYWPLRTGPQDVVGGFDFSEAGGPWVYNDRTP